MEHTIVFGERVGVAGFRGAQDDHAKCSRRGRRYAVFVRDKLQCRRTATGLERGVDLPEQLFASSRVEVMQEIGEEYDVVASAEIGFESAAGKGCVAGGHASLGGIPLRDFEHVEPVGGDN